MCGENRTIHCAYTSENGSSPRVRGKHLAFEGHLLGVGLIPTCAGKTSFFDRPLRSSAAHPHVCGENTLPLRVICSALGSSPRVRGKRVAQGSVRASRRLIPTCAGKTGARAWLPGHGAAHPHVCGENCCREWSDRSGCGSSPRVRGKRYRDRKQDTRAVAHPHVCGENISARTLVNIQAGSSPRVRGKHSIYVDKTTACRLIPTCAGKTCHR